MEKTMKIFIYILITIVVTREVCSCKVICVYTPTERKQDCPTKCCNCNLTLEQLPFVNLTSNTFLLLLQGTHLMKHSLEVHDISNLTLTGYDANSTTVTSSANAEVGFKFSEVKGVLIKNLTFSNFSTKGAILEFYGGENVSLTNINITSSKGAGIACENVSGNTIIQHFNVKYCNMTVDNNKTNQFIYNCSKDNFISMLMIDKSVFTNNNFSKFSMNTLFPNFTLKINIKYCKTVVVIQGSEFSNNDGSNLGITIIGNNIHQNVTIKDSKLTNGRAYKGGGLELNIYDIPPNNKCKFNASEEENVVLIDSVLFDANYANIGAGLFMAQKNHPKACRSKVITIRNSNFTNNVLIGTARGGVALHSISYILKGSLTQIVPQYKPVLLNCIFMKNDVANSDNNTKAVGNGVIFINKNDYFGITNITVRKNKCTAILAVTSNIIFEGNSTLSNNTAPSGGGLLLCKNGILYFRPHTLLLIENNEVLHTGGGITVESQCLQKKPRCFYQLDRVRNFSELETINVNLKNNTATYAGDNLFGGLVDFCYMIDDQLYRNQIENANLLVYKKIFTISPNNSRAVTSKPQRVCLCDKRNKVQCNNISSHKFSVSFGESFTVNVITVGQLEGNVPGTVEATWIDSSLSLKDAEKVQNIHSTDCTKLHYTPLSAKLKNTSTLQLSVRHTGDVSAFLKLPAHHPLNVTVKFLPCPIGFLNNNITTSCNCENLSRILDKHVHCNLNSKRIIKSTRAQSWIGANTNTELIFNLNCPYDYCKRDTPIKIRTDNTHIYQDSQCNFNRTGILCGKCKPGMSMILGSSECEKCSNSFLSLVLVFALAGILLVFVLTYLNLTIAEGTLSGLIFYANIVHYNIDLFDENDHNRRYVSRIPHVFIAWLNLDLGIPVCFYDGMDTYVRAWLQFIFPAYIWTISITIIFLSNKSQIIAAIVSKNATKVLATLVLLSYTKFLQAVVRVFTYTNLLYFKDENGTVGKNDTILWLEDPNVIYFGKKHLILFVFGIVFGAISLPFALMLLFIKPLQFVSHRRAFKWVHSLKPFLDAYTGPYTDMGRFWPGLLLLVRFFLSVAGGFNYLASAEVKSALGVLTILLLLGITKAIQPSLYAKFILDKLEIISLLNLGSLYLATGFYSKYHKYGYKLKYFYYTSVGLAFVIFIVIVSYHTWLKIRHYRCTLLIVERTCAVMRSTCFRKQQRTETLHNFPPLSQFDEDREPLLADHEE